MGFHTTKERKKELYSNAVMVLVWDQYVQPNPSFFYEGSRTNQVLEEMGRKQ